MEVFVLFDEEMGECKVFMGIEGAKNYFQDKDTGGWRQPTGDNTLWMSKKGLFYIFKREIID